MIYYYYKDKEIHCKIHKFLSTFESYSKVSEFKKYEKGKKEEYKSFKMNFDGKEIPQSLDKFIIVKAEDPISQGNTLSMNYMYNKKD